MPVTIESAGSHVFDLGHLRRQGGEELVERVLRQAGLDADLTWRVQVQKKLFCNGETPPFRVVDEPKKWAVYLKIKPGDNNSCHYCSLLMPDGLQGNGVYSALKGVEDELDRNWKNADRNGATAPNEETPDMSKTQNADRPPSPLRGWSGDPEKTRLLLLAIQEIDATGSVHSQEHFVELLCDKLGWSDVNRHEVGGVFTSLVRKDLIQRVLRGSKAMGYTLTDEGWLLIKDLVDAPAAKVEAAGGAHADSARMLRSFGPIAVRLAEAHGRLEQIAAREAELLAELEALRRQRDDICKLLEDQEVQEGLTALLARRPHALPSSSKR